MEFSCQYLFNDDYLLLSCIPISTQIFTDTVAAPYHTTASHLIYPPFLISFIPSFLSSVTKMYLENGCWFRRDGSLHLGDNLWLHPKSVLCCILEECNVHHPQRILFCRWNIVYLSIGKDGMVDIVKRRDELYSFSHRQHVPPNFSLAWNRVFDKIELSCIKRQTANRRRQARWRRNSKIKTNNSRRQQLEEETVIRGTNPHVADDDHVLPSEHNESNKNKNNNNNNPIHHDFPSDLSSVVPTGYTKCRCHAYYPLEWNGSCTICGTRNINNCPNYINNNWDDLITVSDISNHYLSDSDYSDDDLDFNLNDDEGEIVPTYDQRGRTSKKQYKQRKRTVWQPPEYREARAMYKAACQKREVDKVGCIRFHHAYEQQYFEVACKILYQKVPLMKKDGEDSWKYPKNSWFSNIRRWDYYPEIDLVESLISFSCLHFKTSLRHGWENKLKEFPLGSETRFCYSLLLCVAAQGMGDVGVVPHINSIMDRYGYSMELERLQDTEFVSILLRRTSKWVKNAVVVSKLAEHIVSERKGVIPIDFLFYTGIKSISQKTTALLFWAWREENHCLPVDLHVAYSFKRFGWCPIKASREEIAFQSKEWLPSHLCIKLNDSLGAIGQQLNGRRSLDRWNKTAAMDAFSSMLATARQWHDSRIVDLLSNL